MLVCEHDVENDVLVCEHDVENDVLVCEHDVENDVLVCEHDVCRFQKNQLNILSGLWVINVWIAKMTVQKNALKGELVPWVKTEMWWAGDNKW